MVKRPVKLAQVVCAVYALNSPTGASKEEILRFCQLRFGVTCTNKEFDKVLERGLDEGLLTSFRKRFRVTKIHHGIVWAGDTLVQRVRKRAGRRKRRKDHPKPSRKRSPKRRTNKFSRGKLIVESCVKQTSSFYMLWKKELKRQMGRMKKNFKKISNRGKSFCKRVKRTQSSKQQIFRVKSRGTMKSKKGKFEKIKSILNLKRKVKDNRSFVVGDRKSRYRHKSKVLSDNIGTSSCDRYRSLMRQTKHAVVHGKSWDSLNFSRQKRMRENQEMVKNSQLIQKILTKTHASSWDDLNSKLKEMKEKISFSSLEDLANGDAPTYKA